MITTILMTVSGNPRGGYTQIVEKLLEDIPVLIGVSLQEYQTANAARTADEQGQLGQTALYRYDRRVLSLSPRDA